MRSFSIGIVVLCSIFNRSRIDPSSSLLKKALVAIKIYPDVSYESSFNNEKNYYNSQRWKLNQNHY